MNPTTFKEKNRTLTRPPDMTDEQCTSLDVYTDGETCVSSWRMTLRERISALLFGRCWIGVRSGQTQPPVWIMCSRSAFVKQKKVKKPKKVKRDGKDAGNA